MQFPRTTKILDRGCDAIVGMGDASIKLLNIACRSVDNWDKHQREQLKADDVRFNYDLARDLCAINKEAQKTAQEFGEEAFKNAMSLVKSWDPDFKELDLDPVKPAVPPEDQAK